MAAIAESDDLYAWLIRGFVEAGLPDHTRGGAEWVPSGALNLENFIQAQGAGGILLQFVGRAYDAPAPEDEYTYAVHVVRDAAGARVEVVSEDTIYHQVFGAKPAEGVAATVLAEIRAHNDEFTRWRARGGETTLAQRSTLPRVRGATCDRALVTALESLRRAGRSVAEGPRNGWWVKAKPSAGVGQVELGLGQDPTYITRKPVETLSEEDLAHAARVRTAGTVLLASSTATFVFLFFTAAYAAYQVYALGVGALVLRWWLPTTLVTGSMLGLVHAVAGWRMRSLRSRTLSLVLVILGMLPCLAPCCGLGIPVGIWALVLLRNERSKTVFAD